MKIYNDVIENAVGFNSISQGEFIGSSYTSYIPPSNGLIVQGQVGIGTFQPQFTLDVRGSANITGFTTSTGFFGPGTNLTNLNASNLTQGTVPASVVSGTYSGITSVGNLTQLYVIGFTTSTGFFGPGTNLTNLNASNLTQGTVPTSVVSGTYSGITSVGNLTQLYVIGFTTSTGFFGPGTNLTNLNASNLTQGTVPTSVISGTYSGITSVGNLTQLYVTGFTTSTGFFGPGTNLTNLNASNLTQGTVPTSVVSGTYSGITSVGNLTQLYVTGFTTSTGFFGPGTNLTNLNASNLTQGTVPTSVVSGTYSGITSVGNLTQLYVIGFTTSTGFFGPGTNLTNLNASNLTQGTVPTSVVSGTYSGITSVGNLTNLYVSGVTTSFVFYPKNQIYDRNNTSGSLGNILSSVVTGVAWSTPVQLGIVTGTILSNQVAFGLSNSAIQGSNNLWFTGTKFGVGTNNPLDTFDVYANSNHGLFVGSAYTFTGINTNVPFNYTYAGINQQEALTVVQGVSNTGYTLILGLASVNNYAQVTMINRSFGINASSDFLAQSNTGSETSNYVDMGINNSNYSQASSFGAANDFYIYGVGSNMWVGNQSANNMFFFTGASSYWTSVTRMTITGIGSVGIRTTTPTQLFHVNGNMRNSGAYYDVNNSPGTINQILLSTVTGTAWSSPLTGISQGGTNTTMFATGSVLFMGTSAIAENNAKFYWDNLNVTFGVGTSRTGSISSTNPTAIIKGTGFTTTTSTLAVQNSLGTSQILVRDDGYVTFNNSKTVLNNNVPDSASAVSAILDTANTITTQGARFLSIRNHGTEALGVGKQINFLYGCNLELNMNTSWNVIHSEGRLDIDAGTVNEIYFQALNANFSCQLSVTRAGDAGATATQKGSLGLTFQSSLWNGASGVFRYNILKNIASTTVNQSHRLAFLINCTDQTGTAGVESASMVYDGTNYRTGINNTAPSTMLDVTGAFRSGPIGLTDTSTIVTDASKGNLFRVTLGGNRTLANPISPADGQKAMWEFIQDGTGGRTLSLDTSFAFGTDIISVGLTTIANKRDFMGAVYNSNTSKWYIIAFVGGY